MADDRIDDLLRAVWAKNRPIALERARRLAALDAPDDELRQDAHSLAGALGMYGLATAGELAGRVDALVVDGALADPDRRTEVARLGAELHAALEATSG